MDGVGFVVLLKSRPGRVGLALAFAVGVLITAAACWSRPSSMAAAWCWDSSRLPARPTRSRRCAIWQTPSPSPAARTIRGHHHQGQPAHHAGRPAGHGLLRLPRVRNPRQGAWPHRPRAACPQDRGHQHRSDLRTHLAARRQGHCRAAGGPGPQPLAHREPPALCPRLHLRRRPLPRLCARLATQSRLPDQHRDLDRPLPVRLPVPAGGQPPFCCPALSRHAFGAAPSYPQDV